MFAISTVPQRIIASSAMGIAFLGYFPQIIKIIENRSAEDISYLFLIFLITATILWVTYAIMRRDLLMTFAYTAGFIMTMIVLSLKIHFQRTKSKKESYP